MISKSKTSYAIGKAASAQRAHAQADFVSASRLYTDAASGLTPGYAKSCYERCAIDCEKKIPFHGVSDGVFYEDGKAVYYPPSNTS